MATVSNVRQAIRDDIQLHKLGLKLRGLFSEVENKRRYKEDEWISALRQVKGIYDPEVEANIDPEASHVYPKYSKSKEKYIKAKINSIVFPEQGKSWGIEPTPEPELSEDIIGEVTQLLMSREPNFPQGVTQAAIDAAVMEVAYSRSRKMERLMEDQLEEAKYEDIYKAVILSGIRYGTGVWKGPMAEKKKINKIVMNANGELVKSNISKYSPTMKFVPIWYFYPDMSVTSIEQASFIFELHCLTKKDLLELTKMNGFFKDVILSYMEEHIEGDYQVKYWEEEIRAIKEDNPNTQADKPTIKAYEVLEYWGYVDGTFIKAAGIETDKEILDSEVYETRVWLLGDKVIKISLNPLPYGSHPYNVFYFDKDETSIFGEGLHTQLKGTQDVICTSARMMLDNAAIVAGPQLELNIDLLGKDQDYTSVYPRKIWYREGNSIDAQYPAVRSITFDSHIEEYIRILEVFRKIGDEESSLPSILWNDLQKDETARGVSVRYQTAHITLMDIIKEFDKANERFLRALYKWNIEFNDDKTIVGDFTIKAKGTDTLLEREAMIEAMTAFAQTLAEDEKPYVRTKKLLEEKTRAFGLDPEKVLRTEQEAQKIIERQQQMSDMQLQLSLEKIKAETEYERAKAANMLAKSKKTMTDEDLAKYQFAKENINEAEAKATQLTEASFGEAGFDGYSE